LTAIWKLLYAMVWLAFLQIILIFLSKFTAYLIDAHVLLGLVILALAHVNNAKLKRTEAPARLKRTAKATVGLATIQPILGIALLASAVMNVIKPFVDVVSFLHLAIALAIITQASSVATAYDMWEDREFELAPTPKAQESLPPH
jgi:uncharacterized membrane protein